jgi:hypothetical protein
MSIIAFMRHRQHSYLRNGGSRLIESRVMPGNYEELRRQKQIAQKKKAEEAKNELNAEVKAANIGLQAEKEKQAQEEEKAVERRTFLGWVEGLFDDFSEFIIDFF